ncbi:hypothetical protein J437_LFUL001009 [Ladona fulva]|uniref:NADH dehydrogenase [ubiquinone] 1 beta subcomplex subunit 5, mitochondrial n=1 Tax=Ladona fulva TaxID=123851 RepID=A0A8K0P634_LADFU|nr:hypothetical protein J437_LFUL001009 [Ladona fulva]
MTIVSNNRRHLSIEMAVWSSLRSLRPLSSLLSNFKQAKSCVNPVKNAPIVQRANMSGGGHRVMDIVPSRWQWHRFKDILHYYVLLGVIPMTAVILYANIFIGPAQLTEIPEGYVPKHWEYYRHPITRFIARYILQSPQQEYEKMLHMVYEEAERMKLRKLEKEVKAKMAERGDYKAYYYLPAYPKYYRYSRELGEKLESIQGD